MNRLPSFALKPLSKQTIVITGASSGIGLATAKAAAARGARVVLVARDQAALDGICREIEIAGAKAGSGAVGRAVGMACDVAQPYELDRIAAHVVDELGGFDTWVNNAGLSIVGKLEEIPETEHRKLFDTNFWGLVRGSLAAARHLKQNGKPYGGSIVNVGSVASDLALPLQGMYSASKHAVKGFTDALRIELAQDRAPISVTLVKPASINTPFPAHARNHLAGEVRLPDPVYAPEEVAHAILHAATHPVRDVFVGGGGRVLSSLNHFFPSSVDRFSRRVLMPLQQRNETATHVYGSYFEPRVEGRVEGDHPGYVFKKSWYTRAALNPGITAVATLGLLAGVIALTGRGRNSVTPSV